MNDTIDMRDRILAAATRLFARHGFGNTSIARIADEVGIRKPSLLYHFASKDVLHAAVIDSVVARWNERLPKLMLAANTGEGRFEAIVWEVVSFFSEDRDRARLLLREMLDRPELIRLAVQNYLGDWMRMITTAIARGQREGGIRSDIHAPTAVMQSMHQLVGGIASYDVLNAFSDASADDAYETYLTQLVRFTHSGLFVDAPSLAAPSTEATSDR